MVFKAIAMGHVDPHESLVDTGPFLGDTKRIHHKDTIESSCRENLYKHHLSIKKVKANELRQEIGGGTLVGRERILGNRDKSETQGES